MKHLVFCLICLIGIIVTGCSHTSSITEQELTENTRDVNYSVIYYIHADADYLYHNSDGKPIQANSRVLSTALEVGEAARSGEVFIYYQRPERKILGLFPRKSSRFYQYKNGLLINHMKYRHEDKREPFLTTEAQLMTKYRTDSHQTYFLYFGHEIPLGNNKGYHRSLPGIDVNTFSFATGIQNFLKTDDERFSLVALSTCNNGTPEMAKLLTPFTHTLLASPQNLHLSHIDSDAIQLLETNPDISSLQLGRFLGEFTFQRLDTTVHTTISLALYDLKTVSTYIKSLSAYTAVDKVSERPLLFKDNIDCAKIHPFDPEAYTQGIEIWYKPARFGRQSAQLHSGWGCKPVMKHVGSKK